MHPPPEYPDFYVAVLTIVPIVLAGQFLVLRLEIRAGTERMRRLDRMATRGGLISASVLALTSITLALMALGGFAEDASLMRILLLLATVFQVALGIAGAAIERRPRTEDRQP
ncbi:hypothetical protein SAMN06893096_103233 [Geodermatophilus pulveris]|uniref:Uncharacterized protein n=1 Tax=Geodermatophilus pulveris TaxID=1564159 RepID=A0A239DLI6_9ACTN|nr:hypothetical protein [Geodermatophilus pulveris]SNS32692.1 hypothetical protein SAMN06893096_103233 [Geodermatophilus pulveris]